MLSVRPLHNELCLTLKRGGETFVYLVPLTSIMLV